MIVGIVGIVEVLTAEEWSIVEGSRLFLEVMALTLRLVEFLRQQHFCGGMLWWGQLGHFRYLFVIFFMVGN